jgi:ribosomal protein S18 acetylase RimI-like enzyme
MARSVWREHFPGIITEAQIEYMLSKMYSQGAVSEEFERGLVEYCFIVHNGERVGFCSYGPSDHDGVMTVHKLYVLSRWQRHGFGKGALCRIEALCRKRGFSGISLAVNKGNSNAIRAYTSQGFTIHDSVAVDIGGGFIMDDYIMTKELR